MKKLHKTRNTLNCCYLIFRCESNENVLACLSEESIRKRRRRNTIGIQIAFISWLLEFVAGILYICRYWMMQADLYSEWGYRLFNLFDLLMCFVLIPSSYLLNNEAVKLFIHAEGWTTFFRTRFKRSNDLNENHWRNIPTPFNYYDQVKSV